MPQKPESRFKERVARDLKALAPKLWFVKIQQVSIRGIPDFLINANGRFLALELKSNPKSPVSPLQEWTLKEIARTNGIALITFPSNWSDTYALIQEMVSEPDEGEEFDLNEDPDSRIVEIDWDRVSKKVRN